MTVPLDENREMTPVEVASLAAYREIRARHFEARRRKQSVLAIAALTLMTWMLVALALGAR